VWQQRPSIYTAAVVVVIAALTVGLSNWQKLQDGIAAREATTALQDVGTIEQALKRNPSNALLQLTAAVVKEAQETHWLAQKLSDEIEPPSLVKDIDYAKIPRAELEAYLRDLKTAEANATAAMPRYLALLNDERSRVEAFSQSLQIDKDNVRSALSDIDKQHARTADLMSKMLSARAGVYRIRGSAVAILVEQFGNYKVDENARFIFSSQPIADRYNAASSEVNPAADRLNEVLEEIKRFVQSRQEGKFG
jgi:DNA primase large subunit